MLCSACCVTSGSCPTPLNFQTLEAGMTLPVLWQAAGGGPASTQTLSGTQLSSPALATKNLLSQTALLTLVTAGASISSKTQAFPIPPWAIVAQAMYTAAN